MDSNPLPAVLLLVSPFLQFPALAAGEVSEPRPFHIQPQTMVGAVSQPHRCNLNSAFSPIEATSV